MHLVDFIIRIYHDARSPERQIRDNLIHSRVLVGKHEGKRPLGRPRRRWEDNIKMELQEMGCGYMECIDLAQDRERGRAVVNAVMNLRLP